MRPEKASLLLLRVEGSPTAERTIDTFLYERVLFQLHILSLQLALQLGRTPQLHSTTLTEFLQCKPHK